MRSKFTGSAKPGHPAVDRCGAAGSEQRTPDSRAMAGLRSRAIGPGARSWLTGVAGPRSRKRGPHTEKSPNGAPEGATRPLKRDACDQGQVAPSGAPSPSLDVRRGTN